MLSCASKESVEVCRLFQCGLSAGWRSIGETMRMRFSFAFFDILTVMIPISNVGSQARVDFGGANQPKARRKGAEHADYRL
jgi:hypothetical protein